jgi:hypothetical protein
MPYGTSQWLEALFDRRDTLPNCPGMLLQALSEASRPCHREASQLMELHHLKHIWETNSGERRNKFARNQGGRNLAFELRQPPFCSIFNPAYISQVPSKPSAAQDQSPSQYYP